jgi:hypothetical protein
MKTYKLYCAGVNQDTPNAAYTVNEDGSMTSFIFDEANTDYQAFLKYQAEGGVVLPADNNG